MAINRNKKYIVLYVLKDLGKGISTTASQHFQLGQEVIAGELYDFAKSLGMKYETTNHLILIKNIRDDIHIKAVEYLEDKYEKTK